LLFVGTGFLTCPALSGRLGNPLVGTGFPTCPCRIGQVRKPAPTIERPSCLCRPPRTVPRAAGSYACPRTCWAAKCPACGTTFAAAAAAAAGGPATPPPGEADRPTLTGHFKDLKLSLEEDGSQPVRDVPPAPAPLRPVTVESEKQPAPQPSDGPRPCPYCGEHVSRLARRCRYCGEDLGPRADRRDDREDERPWETRYGVRRDAEPHRGPLILTLGIISLVTAVIYFLSCIGLPLGIVAWVLGHRDLKRMERQEMDPQGKGLTQAGWICGIIGTVLTGLWVVGVGAMLLLMVLN
jgi:hypothetical protein